MEPKSVTLLSFLAFFGTCLCILLGTLSVHAVGLPVGTISFNGTQVGSDADLLPLTKIIGQAKVVALGESFHTSGGYHAVKVRIIKYLVESFGFRAIGLETPRLEAQAASDYVATCKGSVANAQDSIFSVFDSTDMRDLLSWLCQFNKTHSKDPVRFFGFDIQEPGSQAKAVHDFLTLTKAAPGDISRLESGLQVCALASAWMPVTDAARFGCHQAINDVLQYLAANQLQLIANSSSETFALAQLALRGLNANEDKTYYQFAKPDQIALASEPRDQGMADTVITLRQLWFPSGRAILWAHNGHIEKAGDQDGAQAIAFVDMGERLKAALKNDYVAIGLVSYRTDINWPNDPTQPRCQKFPPSAASNFVEAHLHTLNTPNLIVDLNAMRATPQPFLDPNAVYLYGPAPSNSTAKVFDEFDGLIYLEHSPEMVSTRWADCSPDLSGFSIDTDFSQCSSEGDTPPGWGVTGQGGSVGCEQSAGHWRVKFQGDSTATSEGVLGQCFGIPAFAHRVQYTATLSTANITNGSAGLFVQVMDANGQTINTVDMTAKGVSGTTSAKDYSAGFDVPSGAAQICYGVGLIGPGTVWVDGIRLTGEK